MEKVLPYQYIPLSHARAIRVLRLRSGTNYNDPLYGELIEATPNGSYFAVSYTWNGESTTSRLYIDDGGVIMITPNCEAALRRFRVASKLQNLWVDAICINQQDIPERNAQVEIMGEIYARARGVLAWLGAGDEHTEVDFNCMRRISDLLASDKAKNAETPDKKAMIAHELQGFSEDQINSVGMNEYWERSWTLQELALSEHAWLYYGSSEPVNFEAMWWIQDYRTPKDFATYLGTSLLHLSLHMQRKYGGIATKSLDTAAGIYLYLGKRASDPKDKVFALKSIFPHVFGELTVDYAMQTADIFREATRLVIEHERSLEILLHSFRLSDDSYQADMSSWALDWDTKDLQTAFSQLTRPFRASSDSVPRFRFSADGTRLFLLGVVLPHELEYMSDVLPAEFSGPIYDITGFSELEFTERIERWTHIAKKFRDTAGMSRSASVFFEEFKTLAESLCRWLKSEEHYETVWKMIMDNPRDLIEAFSSGTSNPDKLHVDLAVRIIRLFIETGGLKFATFLHGGMGVVHQKVQRGDRVALLSGLSQPFVVRSVGSSYILLGPAVVPGVMDGQSWPEDESQLQEFEFI